MKTKLLSLAIGLSVAMSAQAKTFTLTTDANYSATKALFADTDPPIFAINYPIITNATQSGFELTTNINEEGITYYVILADNADAPTAIQVSNGQTADGTNAAESGFFNNTTANSDYGMVISSLLPDVDYDVYVVAKDLNANLQSAPVKLEVKTSLVPLPVELTAFTGTAVDKTILLSWNTASEQNNDYFEIQHSGDGKTFRPIGNLNGAGTSTSSKDYAFVDENPNAGVNYYQLVQHDVDGRTSTSFTIALNSKIANSKLDVYAGGEHLKIFISSANQTNGKLQVFEIGGKRLISKNISLDRGYNTLNLPFTVQPGIHFVRFTSDSENLVKKFIR